MVIRKKYLESRLFMDFRNVPRDFWKDKDNVMKAVSYNGILLSLADNCFRNMDDVVLKAVSNNGIALRYASRRLRNDNNIVLTAICENSFAYRYASRRFKRDYIKYRNSGLNISLKDFLNGNFKVYSFKGLAIFDMVKSVKSKIKVFKK